jgi:hypothetical protein
MIRLSILFIGGVVRRGFILKPVNDFPIYENHIFIHTGRNGVL